MPPYGSITERWKVQKRDGIDDSAAVDILVMIIAGGSHTTSSILQSFFKIIGLYPEVAEKAHLGMTVQLLCWSWLIPLYRTRSGSGTQQAPYVGG